MIWEKNDVFLKKAFPLVSKFLQDNLATLKAEPLEIIEARNKMVNIAIQMSTKKVFFHSQYDPWNEAQKVIEKYEGELQVAQHVVFYGVGLGYHISAIMERFPELTFTIYDPFPAVFYHCIHQVDHNDIFLHKAKNIYLGNYIDHYLNHFVSQTLDKVVIIPQSAYENMFADQYKKFLDRFRVQLKQQRLGIGVNLSFQRLWIVNAMLNFNKVLKTPNIFKQYREKFTAKPIILVSAGPSLEEEYEHLRLIKSKGIAYIIAVGSANRALIAQNIHPDAVCSYDPSRANHEVYNEIIEQMIDSIPLIFGSTVGFQTTELYPGPKIHMITSQDSISKFLLGDEQLISLERTAEIINDAPSIAIIALELFSHLGCNRVILVGQNFAFKNNQYYSKGIAYSDRSTELLDDEKSSFLETESVDGGTVLTSNAHNVSRNAMENYISRLQGTDIINTTNGGAKIHGARFITLDEVIQMYLQEEVVVPRWFENTDSQVYDLKPVFSRKTILIDHHDRLEKIIMNMSILIKKIEAAMKLQHIKKVEKIIGKFNDLNQRMWDNKYYQLALQPMVRIQYALLQKELGSIQREKDLFQKAAMIIQFFGSYIMECQLAMRDTDVFYQHFIQVLKETEDEYLQADIEGEQIHEYGTNAVVGK